MEVDPIDKAKSTINGSDSDSQKPVSNEKKSNSPVKYRFAIIADPHKDMLNLERALKLAKASDVKFIVGMGDFSDVGTNDELRNIKSQFDMVGLPYYVGADDHDLWDSRDKGKEASTNFKDVFGTPYQSFSYGDTRMIIVYNSDNYLGLDEYQLQWLESELGRASEDVSAKQIFVFAPTPLFHPSSDHVMGKVTPKLKDQAEHLTSIFKKSGVDQFSHK